jgi:hypothetical protein
VRVLLNPGTDFEEDPETEGFDTKTQEVIESGLPLSSFSSLF